MLISDSMSLLWLSYAVLSLLVLIAGYLALGFLPRLPRLVISWAVAGLMWVPARYSLPLLEQGESYHGMAPAVVVAGLSFLEGDIRRGAVRAGCCRSGGCGLWRAAVASWPWSCRGAQAGQGKCQSQGRQQS
jgi:hypothetical protein